MSRVIGIIHRMKRTKEGEARPTRVAIITAELTVTYDLEDETGELDFLKGQFPTDYRPVEESEDLSSFKPHQLMWRKLKKEEKLEDFPAGWTRSIVDENGRSVMQLVTKVPIAFDGLTSGDSVAMYLGGSGDYLAAGLSRQGERIGARVFRVPASYVKTWRGQDDKNLDHVLLAQELQKRLVTGQLDPFYQMRPRDRGLIRVSEALRLRTLALKQRISCGQRVEANAVGTIFMTEDGPYPEGMVSVITRAAQNNDAAFAALQAELVRRDKDLKNTVRVQRIWIEVFANLKGAGPRIAAGLIAPICDIRRFWVDPTLVGSRVARQKGKARLKKFCGVHVMPDGSFPRRRVGQLCNWSPGARQTVYLIVDQFNRRPETHWGQRLLAIKAKLRQIHPETVEVEVKGKKVKRYTDGHIHKMALWRCATKFIEWLFNQWTRIEEQEIERERSGQTALPDNSPSANPIVDEDMDDDSLDLSAA